jgi:hypothetical protein
VQIVSAHILAVSHVGSWHAFPCRELGRARQLCPGTSDVDFLRNLKGVIDLNAQVSHRALDLRVAEQQLNRP